MRPTRNSNILLMFLTALALPFCAVGQTALGDIQTKLEAKFALTVPAAGWTDVTTAGAVLVLKKDNLMMIDAASGAPPFANAYKDGKFSQGSAIGNIMRRPIGLAPAPAGPAKKPFLSGRKMWLTNIDVKKDGVTFELFTDAISNVRYRGAVTFPFAKGTIPTPDEVERMVSEVFGVVPVDTTAQQQPKAAPSNPPPAPAQSEPTPPAIDPPKPAVDTPPPAIEPPPPPPPDTKTVALGMTADEVIAIMGQPNTKADRGAKGVLMVYKDVKITLVNGKVTDIE